MTMDNRLPAEFSALEPFVETWALAGSANRAARRNQSRPEQREAFFAAASPLLDSALKHLDGLSLDAVAPPEQRLMNLMLTLAHVALAVEIQGPDEIKSAPWRDRMRIERSTADRPGAANASAA